MTRRGRWTAWAGLLTALMVAMVLMAPLAARAAPYAAVVMDMRTGEILHARNHDTRLHPASLTKMMTLYIAFEAIANGEITLDTKVRISRNAAGQPCSCLGLRTGQTIALRYLIRAAAVRSGNDAATAIGEAISGSEAAFIDRMNRTARALGMNSTSFRNAHGLTHAQHLSTARDMTTLARQLFFDFPQYYNLFSRRSADAGVKTVTNTNRAFLNGYSGADGIKTGYTRAAGFNLAASAERGSRRILVTMFGGQSVPDRTRRVTRLMDMGFARAPATAAVRRPPPPDYGGQPPAGVALAAATRTTAPQRSPLPPLRPAAAQETLMAALEEGVAAALADTAADAPPPPRDPAAAVAGTAEEEARTAALAAAVALALPDEETAAEDLPFARADPPSAPVPEVRNASLAAVEPVARPVADPPLQSIAEAARAAPGAASAAIPFAVLNAPAADERSADAESLAETPAPPRPEPQAAAEGTQDARGQIAAAPSDRGATTAAAAPPPAGPDPSEFVVLTYALPEGAEAPRLAELAETGRAAPVAADTATQRAQSDVVLAQISTSSPRLWGVKLGRFGTRDAAERELMRAALAELSSFEAGLRRVQSDPTGFDATFVGLTESEARIACDRLHAVARDCAPISP